jgi:hypothetical protein
MDDREELIQEKIRNEDFIEMTQLQGIREEIREILIREKGFHTEEVEINPIFRINLANSYVNVSIDLAINLNDNYFMIIKCATATIESWERYVISFARAARTYQIPYAAITDGKNIRIFDAISGSLLSGFIDRLFDREEAVKIFKNLKKIMCSEKNLEKEKRIIYAFENIKCLPPEQGK